MIQPIAYRYFGQVFLERTQGEDLSAAHTQVNPSLAADGDINRAMRPETAFLILNFSQWIDITRRIFRVNRLFRNDNTITSRIAALVKFDQCQRITFQIRLVI